jgi:polysaccharide pyruvyl transferase WcaK-like protein
VVGSDEVFKLEWGAYSKPFPNWYWLSPQLRAKKFAMSASGNLLEYKQRNLRQQAQMRELLDGFDFLGLRDKHTLDFTKHIGVDQSKVAKMCDPALAFDFPQINLRKKLASLGVKFSRPLLGVRLAPKVQKMYEREIRWFKARGFQVVSFMHNSPLADVNIGAKLDPFEWVNLFPYLRFCISNSYHSLIFSLKNNVPIKVVDVDPAYQRVESKTKDLLRDMGMLYCYEEPSTIIRRYQVSPAKLQALQNTYLAGLGRIKTILRGN